MTFKQIKMETDNAIKRVLKNEYMQIISICVALWFFVTNVVIPISTIQSQLATIQLTLSEIKQNSSSLDTRITQNSNAIIVLQQKIGI